MKNKALSLLLSASMAAMALAGCGGNKNTTAEATTVQSGQKAAETAAQKGPYAPDIMHFDAFPARASFLIFAGCKLGREELLRLYDQLPVETIDEEARRNIAVRLPMMWL